MVSVPFLRLQKLICCVTTPPIYRLNYSAPISPDFFVLWFGTDRCRRLFLSSILLSCCLFFLVQGANVITSVNSIFFPTTSEGCGFACVSSLPIFVQSFPFTSTTASPADPTNSVPNGSLKSSALFPSNSSGLRFFPSCSSSRCLTINGLPPLIAPSILYTRAAQWPLFFCLRNDPLFNPFTLFFFFATP